MTVKFSDQSEAFPKPVLGDLKAPMYIHFMFNDENNTIQTIDVREVGYDASKGGPGAQHKGVVSNLDLDKGHLEVILDSTGRTTFLVDPKGQLQGVKTGDSVTLLIEQRGGQEIVTKITNHGGGKPDDQSQGAEGERPRRRR